MAGTDWQTGNSVAADLLKNARLYSFFQAVRTLQSVNRDAPRIGHNGPPQRERIRLRPVLDFAFPLSDIDSVEEIEQEDGTHRYRIDVAFMGLYGTSSPLPSHYTEDFLRREERESLLRGFLDIFHHRLLSLFYRVWEKYRTDAQFKSDASDYFTLRLLALLGMSRESIPHGHRVDPLRTLAYAGLISQQPRSAHLFEGMLSDYFPKASVDVEPFHGTWTPVPQDQQNRLGLSGCVLARDLTVGDQVFTRASAFKVGLSGLSFDEFMEFLPHGAKMPQLRELVDLFNTDCLDYVIELCVKAEEVPGLTLSGKTAWLGWSSWLGQGRPGSTNCVKFSIRGWFHGRR